MLCIRPAKKVFKPAFGCTQRLKAGQNTQQLYVLAEIGCKTLVVEKLKFLSKQRVFKHKEKGAKAPWSWGLMRASCALAWEDGGLNPGKAYFF